MLVQKLATLNNGIGAFANNKINIQRFSKVGGKYGDHEILLTLL